MITANDESLLRMRLQLSYLQGYQALLLTIFFTESLPQAFDLRDAAMRVADQSLQLIWGKCPRHRFSSAWPA